MEDSEDGPIVHTSFESKTIYALVIEKKQRMNEGFRQIKEMIYDLHSIKLYKLYKEVLSKGIKPYGIRTDAILVMNSEKNLKELGFKFDKNKIGGIKFETGKYQSKDKIHQIMNEPFQIKEHKINEITIKDEYDTKEINAIYDKYNHVQVLGEFPGTGKTTSVKNYESGKKLFITPFNKLAQTLRQDKHEANTLNKLLGFYADGKEYAKMSEIDVTEYDVICFDEIFLYPPHILKKIDLFIKKHPTKKIIATGDVDQLQPIGFTANNVTDRQKYLRNCVDQIFPNQFMLKINKRLKNEADREKLKQLKKDIFANPKNILNTLKKHGFKFIHDMKDVKTTKNICYFNYRTNIVINHVDRNLIKKPEKKYKIGKFDYWPGQELLCRKQHGSGATRTFVNYTYKLESVNSKTFSIIDEVDNKTHILKTKPLLDNFKFPYAYTCHCVQGTSIEGPITIFDVNTPYVDKYYIWTALTRATDFNNVSIFVHKKDELTTLHQSKVFLYFTQKVSSYKNQDNNCNRKWSKDEYIDADWINDEYGKLNIKACSIDECTIPYEFYLNDNNEVISNFTVDRVDSSLAHIKSNCRLLCRNCNAKKGNRY